MTRIIFSFSILLIVLSTSCTSEKTSVVSEDSTTIPLEVAPDSTSAANTPSKDPNCCNCKVTVYLNDPDTTGTNVRDEPGGKVIRQLKYDAACMCEIVNVVDSRNGWLKLEEGGWVFAELFAVDTRNYAEKQTVSIYEYAEETSAAAATYEGEQMFRILGCDKTWLYVKGRDGKKGWLSSEMQCANPMTTCP